MVKLRLSMFNNEFNDLVRAYRANIYKIALRCQKDRSLQNLKLEWSILLNYVLANWKASRKMDMSNAVEIMLESIGRNESREPWFWYCRREPNASLFKITIAIFETINYWCWWEAPVSIDFNRTNLIKNLANAEIDIDWSFYSIEQ